MTCFKCECTYLSIVAGIIAGVVLGVLYALGFVATGIIFWLFLVTGLAGVFVSPIYASNSGCLQSEKCFCKFKNAIITASAGTILTAAAGLIVSTLTSTIATAIVLGLTTFFSVMLVALIICLTNCLCNN